MNSIISAIDLIRWYEEGKDVTKMAGITEVHNPYRMSDADKAIVQEKIPVIIEAIKMLPNIHKLHLRNFNLQTLPDTIGDLTNLQRLVLTSLELSSLPDTIGNLINLNTLYISNNNLRSLPDTIGNLINLNTLNISTNNLRSLPDTIGNLRNLNTLNISTNNLRSLPDTIGNLRGLEILDLTHNRLEELPDTIGNLSSVIELILDGNQLLHLPESIGRLQSVESVVISNNPNLHTLPESITHLDLVIFQYENTPLDEISPAVRAWLRGYETAPAARVNSLQVHTEASKMNQPQLLKILESEVGSIPTRQGETFVTYLTTTLESMIERAEVPKKPTIQENYNRIKRLMEGMDYTEDEIKLITYSLEYVKKQGTEAQANYVENFTFDSAQAYNGPRTVSCGKGIKERLTLSLIPMCMLYTGTEDFTQKKCGKIINALENKEIYPNTNTNRNVSTKIVPTLNLIYYDVLRQVQAAICMTNSSASATASRHTTKTEGEIEALYRQALIEAIQTRIGTNVDGAQLNTEIGKILTKLGAGTPYSVFDPEGFCEFKVPLEGGKRNRKTRKQPKKKRSRTAKKVRR